MKIGLLIIMIMCSVLMSATDIKTLEHKAAPAIVQGIDASNEFIVNKSVSTENMTNVPESFSYQLVMTDSSRVPLANESLKFKFMIVKGGAQGAVVYTEEQELMTNKFGLISANVGKGVTEDSFSSISWGMGSHFLKTEFMKEDDTEYNLLGMSEILAVPYAIEAKHARVADSLSQPVRTVMIDSTDNTGYTRGMSYNYNNDNLVYGVRVDMYGVGNKQAVRGNVYPNAGDDGHKIGVIGSVSGEGVGGAEGLRGQAFSKGYANDGVVGLAGGEGTGQTGYPGEETVGSYNTGVGGYAYNNVWGNVGVFGVTYGSVGVDNLGVVGRSTVNDGSDTIRNVGTRGHANGPGVNKGIVGYSDTGVENYGVVGEAFGGDLNIAIHGVVDDGEANYAGVFDGQVEVNGTLHLNDVLKLMPKNSAPANPSTGDLYLDATDNKVKIFIVDTWKALAFE